MYVALAVSLFGLALLVAYVQKVHEEATGGPPVELLAIRRDVRIGEPVTEDLLMVTTLPAAYLEERHVLASDADRVLGVRFATRLRATETLLWTDLATTPREDATLAGRVPEGMRAIAVRCSEQNGFGGLLAPGDRVDVLLTRGAPAEPSRIVTLPLLQNLLVLSVGRSVELAPDPQARGRDADVSLLVTIEQAALLTQAQHGGRLRLVLRNDNDLEILPDLPQVDDRDVLGRQEQARPHRRFVLERVH